MIAKYLKIGVLLRDDDNQVLIITPYNDDENPKILKFDSLSPEMWGQAYEKHVGQYYEKLGYEVQYCGLEKGFNDGGIDLIARNEDITLFIQCKYTMKSKLSKSKIEKVLYKGGNTIFKKYQYSRKDTFVLVVPSMDSAFTKKKTGKFKTPYIYPLAEYFLSKNSTQTYIRVDITEVPF